MSRIRKRSNEHLEEALCSKIRLVSRASPELRQQEALNKKLKTELQQYKDEVEALNSELEDMMLTESKALMEEQEARTQTYRQLTKAELEVAKLRDQVKLLEAEIKQLKVVTSSELESPSVERDDLSIPLFKQNDLNGNLFDTEALLLGGIEPAANRKTSLPLYPDDTVVSEDAKTWLPNAFNYLNIDLGQEYVNLLNQWIALERTHGWKNTKVGLQTSGRPEALTKWVGNGRYLRKGNEPSLKGESLTLLVKQVREWWTKLKPTKPTEDSATSSNTSNLEPAGSLWGSIDKHGINGLFGLLVCMKWWGSGLWGQYLEKEIHSRLKKDWLATVGDISKTLDALLVYRREKVETA